MMTMKKLVSLLLAVTVFSFALPFAVLAEPDDGTQPDATEEAIDTSVSVAGAVDENAPAEDSEDNEEIIPGEQDEESISPDESGEKIDSGENAEDEQEQNTKVDESTPPEDTTVEQSNESVGSPEKSDEDGKSNNIIPGDTRGPPEEEPTQLETEEPTEVETADEDTDYEIKIKSIPPSVREYIESIGDLEFEALNVAVIIAYLGLTEEFGFEKYSVEEIFEAVNNKGITDMPIFQEFLVDCIANKPDVMALADQTRITITGATGDDNGYFSSQYGQSESKQGSTSYTYSQSSGQSLTITSVPGRKIASASLTYGWNGDFKDLNSYLEKDPTKLTLSASDLSGESLEHESSGSRNLFYIVISTAPADAGNIILAETGQEGKTSAQYTYSGTTGPMTTIQSHLNSALEQGYLKYGSTVTIGYDLSKIGNASVMQGSQDKSEDSVDKTHGTVTVKLTSEDLKITFTYLSTVSDVSVSLTLGSEKSIAIQDDFSAYFSLSLEITEIGAQNPITLTADGLSELKKHILGRAVGTNVKLQIIPATGSGYTVSTTSSLNTDSKASAGGVITSTLQESNTLAVVLIAGTPKVVGSQATVGGNTAAVFTIINASDLDSTKLGETASVTVTLVNTTNSNQDEYMSQTKDQITVSPLSEDTQYWGVIFKPKSEKYNFSYNFSAVGEISYDGDTATGTTPVALQKGGGQK